MKKIKEIMRDVARVAASTYAFVALAIMSASTAVASLPSDYMECEYIQGNGSDAKIVIDDYTPTPNNDKIEAVVSFPAGTMSQNQTIWCSRGTTTTTATWTLFALTSGKAFRFDYGNTTGTGLTPALSDTDVKYTITAEGPTFTSSGGQTKTYSRVSNFTAGGPLVLFAAYYNGIGNNNGAYGKHKLYSFKVWRSGELIHNFVPVVHELSSEKGLYDVEADKFYPGTGSFGYKEVDDSTVTELTGLTTISDVSELEAIEGDLRLGRGTLLYTGASGTVDKNVIIAPSGGNLDTTIDVANENAILTISGNVATQDSNTRFIKKGPGTLRLSGTGRGQRLGYGTGSVSGTSAWDADGYATAGVRPFALAEGRLLLDGGGSAFTLGSAKDSPMQVGGMIAAGTSVSTVLEVANGAALIIPYESFALSSKGTTAAPQDTTLYIHDGGTVTNSWNLRFTGFDTGAGKGRVIVDNASWRTGRIYCEYCSTDADVGICLTNGAVLAQNDWEYGFANSATPLFLDITHSATGLLGVVDLANAVSSIRVHDGGVLRSDRSSGGMGKFVFDNGTWGTRTVGEVSTWGGGSSVLSVGAGGMTLDTDGIAYLRPSPTAAEGADGAAALAKTGSGTLTMRPGATLPLTVRDGHVAFPDPAPLFATGYGAQSVAVGAGAGLVANGEGSWSGKAISFADGAKLAFAARGARKDLDNWIVKQHGLKLVDGAILVVDRKAANYLFGAAWVNQRLRVDRSFTLAFETFGTCGSSLGNANVYAVFHNSPNGTAAVGGNGAGVGLAGSLKNGFALGVDFANEKFSYGAGNNAQIGWMAADASLGVDRADVLGRPEAPTSWRVSYDYDTKKLTLKLRTASGEVATYAKTANLETYCATNEVVFGFGSGVQSGQMGFVVSDMREVDEAGRGVIRTGGDVTVPTGATVAATVSPTEFANGFTAKSLAYGDGSTLDISTAASAEAVPAPYVAFESMGGTGTLVKKGAGNLGFQCPSATGAPNLRLDEGGLVLRKEPLEPLAATMAGGWAFNRSSGGMGYISTTNLWMKTTGFQIGSGTAIVNDGVNSRRRVYVAGNWRMRFKAAALARTSANSLFMTLHDQGPDVSLPTGTDRYIMQWYVYEAYQSALQRMNTASVGSALAAVDNQSSYAPINFCTALPGNGGAGLVDVTIEHDAALERVRCIMAQGGNCVTNDFANQIVAPVSGDGYAYVGFTVNTGSAALKMEVTDFSFERLDGTDPLASATYASTVEIGEDAGAITLDSPMAGGVFKLADSVTIASGATVRAESCGAAATLDIGTPVCAGDTLALAGDSDSTIRVASMPAGVSRITVDGGAFEPFGSFGARGAELALLGGAKVSASGRVSFSSITVDGVKQSSGVYTAENCSFVRGAGSLAVGLGTIIVVR